MSRRLYAVTFAGLGILATLALVGSVAGLAMLAIASHADTHLADLDAFIDRATGGTA